MTSVVLLSSGVTPREAQECRLGSQTPWVDSLTPLLRPVTLGKAQGLFAPRVHMGITTAPIQQGRWEH